MSDTSSQDYTTSDLEEILGIEIDRAKPAESLADEAICRELNKKVRYIEFTISLPKRDPFLKMGQLELRSKYNEILMEGIEKVILDCPSVSMINHRYTFEYSGTNWLHLHGYISFEVLQPISAMGLLKELGKVFYLGIPRKYWKHYVNSEDDHRLIFTKTPLYALNYKETLDKAWLDYMNKNAPRSD